MHGGYVGQVLRVDLTAGRTWSEELNREWARLFIGGKGLGARYLWEHTRPGGDPLGPANPLIIATGPLTGTPALGSSAYFLAKSPLTGAYLDSGVRGYLGAALKGAGYDVVVVTGRSASPVWLLVDEAGARLEDASELWGRDSHETDAALRQRLGGSRVHVATIGPAGENRVRYACVTSDLYRQAGRGGAGAVMGSKNLKAVVVDGRAGRPVPLAEPERFLELVWDLVKTVRENAEPLRTYGTMWLMEPMNDFQILPVRNFTAGTFPEIDRVGGRALVDRMKVKDLGCYGCSLSCSNLVRFQAPGRGRFELEGPEYESAALLGPNCGLGDLPGIAYLNLVCDRLGLDTMSTGGVLAYLMELKGRGLLDGPLAGVVPDWGDVEGMLSLIDAIAHRRGVGDLLAEGVRRVAADIGGRAADCALHVKGMEMPGYDPRGAVGMGLSYAVSDRGACHLRAWTIYEEVMGDLDPYSSEGKAALVAARQNRKAVMDSLGICEQMGLLPVFSDLFTAATGWAVEEVFNPVYAKLLEDYRVDGAPGGAGDRTVTLARLYNYREGFGRGDDTLPERFFTEDLPDGGGRIDRGEFERMLDEFYAIRGWDAGGRPRPEQLAAIGLGDLDTGSGSHD